uniref:Uncharacterized protein n=1 Tax=Arundo donax TaxID=35708 RepID=A0A0A9E7G8_ARUDO
MQDATVFCSSNRDARPSTEANKSLGDTLFSNNNHSYCNEAIRLLTAGVDEI